MKRRWKQFQSPIPFSTLSVMGSPRHCTKFHVNCWHLLSNNITDTLTTKILQCPLLTTLSDNAVFLYLFFMPVNDYCVSSSPQHFTLWSLNGKDGKNKSGIRASEFLLLYWSAWIWFKSVSWSPQSCCAFCFQIHLLYNFRWTVPILIWRQDLRLFFFLSAAQ